MKINKKENQVAITEIRSQITETVDLDKFNSFLASNEVIDFTDEKQQEEIESCCGGDECCKNVTFNTTITTQ